MLTQKSEHPAAAAGGPAAAAALPDVRGLLTPALRSEYRARIRDSIRTMRSPQAPSDLRTKP
jgi:hypothetical protein